MLAEMDTSRNSFQVMSAVWKALLLREALFRLSSGRAAWLWLLLEPLFHVSFQMAIFTLIRQRQMPGFEFAIFLAVGVLGFQMFRITAQRSMEAINANGALFAYRQIKPIDTIMVRALLEGVLQLIVCAILTLAISLIGMDAMPDNTLQVYVAIFYLWIIGTGMGMILAVADKLAPEIAKIVKMMFTPLYLVSGVFFSPFMVPPKYREILLLNPIASCLELIRDGYRVGYPTDHHLSPHYIFTWSAAILFLGLALQVRYRKKMVAL